MVRPPNYASTGAGQDGRTCTDRCTDGVSVCIVGKEGYRHTLTGVHTDRCTDGMSVCIARQDGYRHTLTDVLVACLCV